MMEAIWSVVFDKICSIEWNRRGLYCYYVKGIDRRIRLPIQLYTYVIIVIPLKEWNQEFYDYATFVDQTLGWN